MKQNIVNFKVQSFLNERNTSTMAYEVKAVRAIWDPSLSIPGTNRRGGWRCPTGTRYGGQITDRFGRSCGWGVARRIANQISNIGQRLENVDDARRGRRISRRERRILARLNPQDARAGRLERGLRGVAERLEGGEAPTPRGGRRRAVTARTPSVDAPEVLRELTPAPRAPRRRRAPVRRQPDDRNLRQSEERRMEREIEQPGAPRTGEAPARRRRRAVVEATKKPKAPVRKPEEIVEPKVVKPRRPKPKVDLRERDSGLERLLDEEEEVARRVEAGQNVNIGNPPKDFKEVGRRRWRKGNWYISVDENEGQELGLTASNGQGKTVQARNFDELVRKMDIADLPRPGNSDNAARSEELRQNREAAAREAIADAKRRERARGVGRKVDVDQILNEKFFERYIREDVIPNDRIMIVNDPANFPNGAAQRDLKRAEAVSKINRADRVLNKIEQAIARGELSDNDFIERDGERINVARVKTYLKDFKDAWREVFNGNVFDTSAPEASAGKENVDIGDVPADFVPAGNGRWTRGQWTIDVDKDGMRVVGLTASDGQGKIVEAQNFDELVKKMNREIPVVFNQNKNKDIRKAPEALKHQPPKIEPAKFKAEQEQSIEEALLEIRDVASLNKFSLLVDQAIFNENEGRQGALRNFQRELTNAVDTLKRNPDANIDGLIAERKREYLANFQMRGGVANARTKLNELETQLRDKFIKLRTPPGNGAEEKERNRVSLMEDIAKIKKSIGSYEGHLQLVDALEPEIRKASERIKQGFVFNPDATNIPKPTPADVKKKIKDQISAAIDRRQGKLSKYLKERYPDGGAPFEDMTEQKWGALSQNEKNAYIKQAYSHDMIKGKNGKLYNAVASVIGGGSVEVTFNEINAQGQIIRARIGTSSRTVYFGNGKVKQNSMFITSKLDRGADIQTIYNQHAFLYLSKIGITKAEVNAADDGQYVWARVGFKRGTGLSRQDLRALESPMKFYENFGAGGLISNDAEYARIKSILAQAQVGIKFHHQDIIFALDDPTGDKQRMEYVKQWFKPNLGFPGGTLKFSEQKVGGTPVRRPRRARASRQRSVPSEI